MSLTKETWTNIARQNVILTCEVENALSFANDLLYAERDRIKKEEPYATKTLERLDHAISAISDLMWDWNTIDDDEEEDEHYTPSSSAGDYGPSNPWDAPGMSVHDFI